MAFALVTGAGSGIGRSIAVLLSRRGYDIILVSRSKKALKSTAKHIKTKSIIIPLDLSVRKNCFDLYDRVKYLDVQILVNNAGFGVFGAFDDTALAEQLNMLDLNVGALHTLTHLFLEQFKERGKGYILNVSSLAAFTSGPLMSAYYAGKAYAYRLTTAIAAELEAEKSNVHISVLCPGPTETAFNRRAGVKFSIKPMPAKRAAAVGVKGMFDGKTVIIPGLFNKMSAAAMKFLPLGLTMKICYKIQCKKKIDNKA